MFKMVFSAIDDVPPEAFVRMPAHTRPHDVGRLLLGDGTPLAERDRRANSMADVLAKRAVAAHRVSKATHQCVEAEDDRVRAAAMWLGRVTHLANNKAGAPHRDSEASRRRAQSSLAARALAASRDHVRLGHLARAARPWEQGGHRLVRRGVAWACVTCKLRSALWWPGCCPMSAHGGGTRAVLRQHRQPAPAHDQRRRRLVRSLRLIRR